MAIKASERNELRRIVKGRFELLGQQVRMRENEIAHAIRTQILEEHREAMERAHARVKGLNESFKKLEREYLALLDQVKGEGLTAKYYPDRGPTFPREFAVHDLQRRVDDRMRELRLASGFQHLDLKAMELELMESLALEGLEGDDARGFLERIPTVDKLLPLPANGAKPVTKRAS